MASDGEFLPAYQSIGVFASELWVASLSASALVDDLMCAPSVCEEGEDFGDCVAPCVAHVVHARQHEVSRFFIRRCRSSGLHIPRCLSDQHLNREKYRADGVVVLAHLLVDCYSFLALQVFEEFLIKKAAVSFLTEATEFF